MGAECIIDSQYSTAATVMIETSEESDIESDDDDINIPVARIRVRTGKYSYTLFDPCQSFLL